MEFTFRNSYDLKLHKENINKLFLISSFLLHLFIKEGRRAISGKDVPESLDT